MILFEKDKALFRFVVAVLQQKEQIILTQQSPSEMKEYIAKELPHAQYHAEHMVQLASKALCTGPERTVSEWTAFEWSGRSHYCQGCKLFR